MLRSGMQGQVRYIAMDVVPSDVLRPSDQWRSVSDRFESHSSLVARTTINSCTCRRLSAESETYASPSSAVNPHSLRLPDITQHDT